LLVLAALATPARAQSANNFKQQPAPSAPPVLIKPKPKVPAPSPTEVAKATSVPSRYVGEADLAAYVASLASVFSIGKRDTDPFGQFQDPDAKPIIKTPVASTTRRAPTLQATPLSEIVRLIKVTTIMPGENRFLVGTRSVKQGDRIPLVFRGRTLNIEVVSVKSHQIDMRNIDNGETASLKIDLLPAGMTPGTRGITAPGMVPDRPNAPIDLDGATSLNAQTLNANQP
jgi:hypothetical protein